MELSEQANSGSNDKFSSAMGAMKPSMRDNGDLPEVFLAPVPATLRSDPQQESSRVIMETRVIQNLIYSYFSIVKKNIGDLIPKTIMAFLIHESKRRA